MNRRLALLLASLLAIAGGILLLRTENRAVRSAPDFDPRASLPVRRCSGITRGGSRCSRDSEPDSQFCWQHG